MKYQITITKLEENNDYEAEMAEWKEKEKYNFNKPMLKAPKHSVLTRCLETVLTEEEFNAIKKSVLEVFK